MHTPLYMNMGSQFLKEIQFQSIHKPNNGYMYS